MMEFSSLNIFVRQIVNGTMTLSALLVLIIFARYVWNNRQSLRHNEAVQAAAAIMVLMAGHTMRAASSWVEFILLDAGISTAIWLKWTWIWFLLAFIGIVIGKVLMLNMFAPRTWRKTLIVVGIPACIVIPFLIAVSLS